jgi:hypothetical protein
VANETGPTEGTRCPSVAPPTDVAHFDAGPRVAPIARPVTTSRVSLAPPPTRASRKRARHVAPNVAESYRFVRAYWTTLVVCLSYSWFFFRARFATQAFADARIGELHTKNARRVERTIVEL